MGELSNTASDIVGGLRVLRGIGGEQVFHDRYRRESQTTRRAGVEVARLQSVLDALQVFLPGVFVVVVVWLGARYAVAGQITPGELVAFYGYSAFLMIPLRTATEYANKLIRARVAAAPGLPRARADARRRRPRRRRRRRRPPAPTCTTCAPGCACAPGRLTAIVSEQPDESAALADRLGLCAAEVDDDVRLGGVPLTALRRAEVRRRIVVSDTGATLFSGRLGRPPRRHRRRATSHAAPSTPPRPTTSSRRCPRASTRVVAERGRTLLRRPAPAAGAGPRADRRPRDPGAGRADLGRRRPHRGPDRRPAAPAPRRPDHGRDHAAAR